VCSSSSNNLWIFFLENSNTTFYWSHLTILKFEISDQIEGRFGRAQYWFDFFHISSIFTNYSSKSIVVDLEYYFTFFFYPIDDLICFLASNIFFVFIIKSQHKIVFSQRQSHFFNYISSFGNSTFIQITIFAWIFLEPYVIVVSLNNISKKKFFFPRRVPCKMNLSFVGRESQILKKDKIFQQKKRH